MPSDLDGLLTFTASHHAIRADTTLRRAGLSSQLIPGPKDLSPNCGTAVRFRIDEWDRVESALRKRRVEIDEIHRWAPPTDTFTRPQKRGVS